MAVCGLSPLQVYLSVDSKILLAGLFKLLSLGIEIVVDNPVAVSRLTEQKTISLYSDICMYVNSKNLFSATINVRICSNVYHFTELSFFNIALEFILFICI